MKKTFLLVASIPALVAALTYFPIQNNSNDFHTQAELDFFRSHGMQAPPGPGDPDPMLLVIDSNILFPTAKTCGGCHGRDPNMNALITTSGVDVNMYDDWRSTMMANSAKDPFWRAKVTHEIMINPAHSLELQDKCTSCHAPAGHYQSKLKLHQPHYGLAQLYTDTLGLDGVTCQACHAQAPTGIGSFHSGELKYDTNNIRVAYGPYEFVFAPPMHTFVGITPKYGPHISDAGLCAGCHTLITNSVDLAGNATGSTFTEQATYHEWLNSRYDAETDNITCQSCHMEQLIDEIIISANYQFLTPKFPFGLHELAGANVTMLKLMKEHRNKLGINAEAVHFDSTIAATLRMLQQKSLDVTLDKAVLNGDYAQFDLKLKNKAGHKFPSGYPSRRAWVEFLVQDYNGNTLFHSGKMNPDYTLAGETMPFEPHYQEINNPDQVQIYEMVPGDVNGQFTNVLERGHLPLKDNRLTPQGFKKSDPVYDTVTIVGDALLDPDFNIAANGQEGSGADIIHFKIPTNGASATWKITARVWYQSLPPKWMNPMFEYSSPEIDSFKVMYDAADQSPVLISETVLDSVMVTPVNTAGPVSEKDIKIGPNPSKDGKVRLQIPASIQAQRVKVYNSAGQLVWDAVPAPDLMLPPQKGIYWISIETNQQKYVKKVVRE
jgi:hypothetical protein